MSSIFLDPKPLYRIKLELDRVIVKNDREKLMVFSLAMTHKLPKPSNVILVGPSSAGKSHMLGGVMQYYPVTSDVKLAKERNWGLNLTGISAKALNRFTPAGGTWNNKILCVQELDGASEAGPVIRTFLSEGMSSTLVTEKNAEGSHVAKVWSVNGMPAFFVTTANDTIEEQFANRCNVIVVGGDYVDEVLHYEAHKYMDTDLTMSEDDAVALRKDIEAIPLEKHVIVPYADAIAGFWYKDTVVAQRSFPEFVKLIQAIAVIHGKHRKRYKGHIVANFDDYEIARRIVIISKFKLGSGLMKAYRRIVDELRGTNSLYDHPMPDGSKVRGVTREQLTGIISRSMGQIERYLEALCDAGIMRTHQRWMKDETGRGERNPNVYSLAITTEEDIVFPPSAQLLPTEGQSLKRLSFKFQRGNWLLTRSGDVPCTVHAYDPITGQDIDIDEQDQIYLMNRQCKEMRSDSVNGAH